MNNNSLCFKNLISKCPNIMYVLYIISNKMKINYMNAKKDVEENF